MEIRGAMIVQWLSPSRERMVVISNPIKPPIESSIESSIKSSVKSPIQHSGLVLDHFLSMFESCFAVIKQEGPKIVALATSSKPILNIVFVCRGISQSLSDLRTIPSSK